MSPSCMRCGGEIPAGNAHYGFQMINGDGSVYHRWALCVLCGLDVRVFVGEHPPEEAEDG